MTAAAPTATAAPHVETETARPIPVASPAPSGAKMARDGMALMLSAGIASLKSKLTRPAKATKHEPAQTTGFVLTPMRKRLERIALVTVVLIIACLTVLSGPLHKLGDTIHKAVTPSVSVTIIRPTPAKAPVKSTHSAAKPATTVKK